MRQIGDLGFARGVLEYRLAVGQHGGHQQIFRTSHRDRVKNDVRPFEPVGTRADVALFDRDSGTHGLQTVDVQIDGSGANRTAARQRDVGFTEAREQGPEHKYRRTHGLDQFIRRFATINATGVRLDV